MSGLEEIIKSPEQRSGEFWEQASRVITNHPDLLTRKKSPDGEEEILVTPDFTPYQDLSCKDHLSKRSWDDISVRKVECESPEEELVMRQNYGIAAQVHPGQEYTPASPLYLIINGQTTNKILQFERMTGRLSRLDGSFSQLDDSDASIDKILDYVEAGMNAKQRSLDSAKAARHRKHKRGMAILGTVAGLAAGVTMSVFGIQDWRHDNAEDKIRDRQEFDAEGIVIETTPVGAGETSFIASDIGFLAGDVPTRLDGEDLDSPRRFSVTESDCEPVGSLDPTEEEALAITDGPTEQLTIAVNSNGNIRICSFDTPNDNDDDSDNRFDVAVQIRDIVNQ